MENITWKKKVNLLKPLRTNNGQEFCNYEFDSFCKENDILRHRSFKQNGVLR